MQGLHKHKSLLSPDSGLVEFHLGGAGVGHEFLEDYFKAALGDGLCGPQTEGVSHVGRSEQHTSFTKVFPFFSVQQTIRRLRPLRRAAVPQDQTCRTPGDVLKELWPDPGGSFSVVL